MIQDAKFNFGMAAITNSNTATASTNYYDAGADAIVFGGEEQLFLWGRAQSLTADDNPTFRCDLVGSDNADLDPNDNETITNIILASTGVVTNDPSTGVKFTAAAQDFEFCIPIRKQTVARQYYGLLVTLGGTNPDVLVSDAIVVRHGQTNMPGERAAVPA